MTVDPVDQLSVALDATGRVIAAVRDDQWGLPTPCPEWDVRALLSHVIAGNSLFTGILRGLPPEPGQDLRLPAGDLVRRYQDGATALLAAFRQPGVLDQVMTVPAGRVPGIAALHLRITEVLVHGWDVARATGQPTAGFPAQLAGQELAFTRAKLADVPPGRRPFGPPQPVAATAPAIDQLAACLGRAVPEP